MLRLFVAVEIPEAQRRALASVVSGLRPAIEGARFVGEGAWHVTLKFLGPTEEDRLDAVREVIAGAVPAAGGGPVPVRLGGPGAFPSPRRARVVWVGLEDPTGRLGALAAALDEDFEQMGFPEEQRRWRPHLTVARLRVPGPVDLGSADLRSGPEGLGEGFTVNEAVLFRSHLQRQGAVYEGLARFPFGS
jgi:2'-5' RNA ligase